MDIVLEAFDTYIFDSIYAQLFPATPGPATYNAIKSMTGNSTFSKSTAYYNNYQYQPASQYISFSPSKYAYMSSLQRDNAWRQAISLFTITWYGTKVKN
jgi:lathosterol oxidase